MSSLKKKRPFTNNYILPITLLIALFISACSLATIAPSTSSVDGDTESTVATAIAATIASGAADTAANNGASANAGEATVTIAANSTLPPTPQSPPAQSTPNSASSVATETPSSSGQSAADVTLPAFTNVGTASDNVYYGDSSCGSSTVTVQATVSDNVGVSQVWVNYLFAGNMGGGNWNQVNLTAVGNNSYEVDIEIAPLANNDLQGEDGVMQYQVYAMDAAGNTAVMPDGHPYGVSVTHCNPAGAQPQPNNGISIENSQWFPDVNTFYYGACAADQPTQINIQSSIEPRDQINVAEIVYSYGNDTVTSPEYTVDLFELGIGDMAGDIDTAWQAADILGVESGYINIRIHVVDINGNATDSLQIRLAVEPCAVLGDPPSLTIPTINYFNAPVSAAVGDTVTLEWDVSDACKVFLDGDEVNAHDSFQYVVPIRKPGSFYEHTLTAWGSSCSDLTKAESVTSILTEADGNGNGNGNNAVSFVNNSSHPIVSLVVDGEELLRKEQSAIAVGGTKTVEVSAGSHNFTAANGWWAFGVRNEMYVFSGTFDAQDGVAQTFRDPSIADLLTDWQNSRYFGAFYMDRDLNAHAAGLCFYADGTFIEFDNGVQVDNGRFEQIDSSGQTVSTRLIGQSVSVEALYYNSFGTLDVPRGNLVDEFAADNSVACP